MELLVTAGSAVALVVARDGADELEMSIPAPSCGVAEDKLDGAVVEGRGAGAGEPAGVEVPVLPDATFFC